jgi:hypothetical protein
VRHGARQNPAYRPTRPPQASDLEFPGRCRSGCRARRRGRCHICLQATHDTTTSCARGRRHRVRRCGRGPVRLVHNLIAGVGLGGDGRFSLTASFSSTGDAHERCSRRRGRGPRAGAPPRAQPHAVRPLVDEVIADYDERSVGAAADLLAEAVEPPVTSGRPVPWGGPGQPAGGTQTGAAARELKCRGARPGVPRSGTAPLGPQRGLRSWLGQNSMSRSVL